ncbi:hypothetical protein IU449_26695 [Nocardia higoensis]|uniref:DUF397 domain-containing protein n=1 Tax=Nocardia higoensis TaxID=228599 RepID=A0ABS0DHZ4_9NOCA|nr:hypothetical protein [Nocardia higoensis]MBF6358088.1 hypothetical protein [Nocardia higoensis]
MAAHLDEGAWLAYPIEGDRDGEGGDCYEVAFFADDELAALRFVNARDGFRAVFIKPGQTILEAWHLMQEKEQQ